MVEITESGLLRAEFEALTEYVEGRKYKVRNPDGTLTAYTHSTSGTLAQDDDYAVDIASLRTYTRPSLRVRVGNDMFISDGTTGHTATEDDGGYNIVNGAGLLFKRDSDGPVSVDDFTGTDAERLIAASKAARARGERTVLVGDAEYDLTGFTDEIHSVNFIGEGSFINGPSRVRVFPPNTRTGFTIPSGVVPERDLVNFGKASEPVVPIIGDSLSTLFPVSGNIPDNALAGKIKAAFRAANPLKNISFPNNAVGGARFADIVSHPSLIPTTSNWVRGVEVTATGNTAQRIVTLNDTTGIEVGWYGQGTGFGANSRVVSVDNTTQVTMNVDLTATLAGETVSFIKPWYETVLEQSPDTLLVSSGMNDGTSAGWQRFSLSGTVMQSVYTIPARAAKPTDLIMFTNFQPTVRNGNEGFVSDESQEGRQGVAGLVRSTANYYGKALVDVNRVALVMRDGVDVCSLSYTRDAATVNQAWPATGVEAYGYKSVTEFASIPTGFWDLEWDLSKRDGNIVRLYDEGGKLAVEIYDSTALVAQRHISDIDTPADGTDVILHRFVDHLSMRIEVYVVGGPFDGIIGSQVVFDGAIIKGGAKFSPELRHSTTPPALTVSHTYYPGEPELYLPTLFDDEMWQDASDLSEGNAVNHPNAFAQNAILDKTLSFQNFSAPVPTSVKAVGDDQLLELNGEEGVIIDFKTLSYGMINGGVATKGHPDDLLNVATPAQIMHPVTGAPEGVRFVSGASAANIPLSALPFNASEGTLIVEFRVEDDGTGIEVVMLGTTSGGPRIQITAPDDTNELDVDTVRVIYFSGGTQASHEIPSTPFDQMTEVWTSWKVDDFSTAVDGARQLMDTSGIVPVFAANPRLHIANAGTLTNIATVVISKISYYPKKLDTATLLRSGK